MPNQCGKSCESCAVREEINCGGCRYITDNFGCEIAECAEKNNHETCATCTMERTCPTRRRCHSMHKYRAERIEEENRKNAELYERAQILSKWLGILFAVEIAELVLGLLTDVLGYAMTLTFDIGTVVSCVMSVIQAVVILKMAAAQADYRKAAVFMLITVPLQILPMIIGLDESSAVSMLFGIPSLAVSLAGMYYLYNAHSWVCADADMFLSERWVLMWKLNIWFLVLTFVSPLLLLFGLLGLIALLAVIVGAVVIGIFELYNLWHTASLFKKIAGEM